MSYEPCHWLKWNMTLLSNWLCQSVWGYFWKAPQYHYYSVWKVIYFSQNPLNLKSKKLSFQKAKFCPLVYGYINSPIFFISSRLHFLYQDCPFFLFFIEEKNNILNHFLSFMEMNLFLLKNRENEIMLIKKTYDGNGMLSWNLVWKTNVLNIFILNFFN